MVDGLQLSSNGVNNVQGRFDLERIITNSCDSILAVDLSGNVLFANLSTSKMMGIKPEELTKNNVKKLLEREIYDWSPSMKVMETGSVVTGRVKTWIGRDLISVSTPLFDEKGNIIMAITNTRDKALLDQYVNTFNKEKAKHEQNKTVMEYLSYDVHPNVLVAESYQMRQIIKTANIIAKTDSTVIINGESGTGKEVIARYIYKNSLRSKEPFIPVNCAAIPNELMESEIFGYVRGAFTGASLQGKPGFFEMADKGTLFLDEIADLPLSMQSKLLRVLETGEVQRLGSTNIQRTNVRLITATNRDLKSMVDQKLFRNDLYYRLNVIPVNIPPLRERPEDLVVLAQSFLDELNSKYNLKKEFTKNTINVLLDYEWPGNIRELRNIIERLVITSEGNVLDFEDNYPLNVKAQSKKQNVLSSIYRSYNGNLKTFMKAVEKEYINHVLSECNGRVGEASRRLGIHRTMLYRKIRND